MSYAQGGKAPRIVALGMQGMTVFAISRRVGCSEGWAYAVLAYWRASGGLTLAEEAALAAQKREAA
jgi:hypothetical protein